VRRIVLEYGNKVKAHGNKTEFTTFLRIVESKSEGLENISTAVARVDFNINPAYSKPTATVKYEKGASFAYTMARPFPCFMTVHFRADVPLRRLNINFDVQNFENRRRIVVEASGKVVDFDAEDAPRNGWICDSPARAAYVDPPRVPDRHCAVDEAKPAPRGAARAPRRAEPRLSKKTG
jgi:hypothetical protein